MIVSTMELARLFGRRKTAVTAWHTDGMPRYEMKSKRAGAQWNLWDVFRWHIRKDTDSGVKKALQSHGLDSSISNWQEEKARQQAIKLTRANRQADGLLVERKRVDKELELMARSMRTRCAAIISAHGEEVGEDIRAMMEAVHEDVRRWMAVQTEE